MINNSSQIEGVGLLIFAQKMHQYDPDDQRDRAEKCLHMIRELRRQYAVAMWMNENRGHWAWMEPEVGPEVTNSQQSRGDYSGRRGGSNQHQSVPHSDNSDDEDEYEDDEDSRFGQDIIYNEIVVEGCGISEINGVYKRCGHCDDAPKYSKTGLWDGREEDFMLFRCKLTDNTRRWYISIVPGNSEYSDWHCVLIFPIISRLCLNDDSSKPLPATVHPGTTKDIDFYFAPDSPGASFLPPVDGWCFIPSRGIEPGPRVTPKGSGTAWNEDQEDYL